MERGADIVVSREVCEFLDGLWRIGLLISYPIVCVLAIMDNGSHVANAARLYLAAIILLGIRKLVKDL